MTKKLTRKKKEKYRVLVWAKNGQGLAERSRVCICVHVCAFEREKHPMKMPVKNKAYNVAAWFAANSHR